MGYILGMKTRKASVKKVFKPVRILYYSENEVILRAEEENSGEREEFDKNTLSEVDLDKILAIA